VGAQGIAAWIAQIAFWVLLVLGISSGELRKKSAAIVVGLWLAGSLGLPGIAWWTSPLVMPFVAILDIVLVFIVFKGDVKLT
jgi:hypothetical protein